MRRKSLFLFLLAFPVVALAAPRTFSELANTIVTILDTGAGLLILVGVVIYFGGIALSIRKRGDEDRQKFRTYAIWGIFVLFIMVSIWGILELLQNTLFGNDPYNPSTGTGASSAQFQVPKFSE